jgi:hypothetical protein
MDRLPALPPAPPIPARSDDPFSDAMYDIADALHYPVDSQGRVFDVKFMLPVLAYHLARCGAVIDPSRALIKARRLPPAPGVFEDAVEWVPLSAPDSIDDELAGATIDDVESLSPAARAELIRRLGGEPPAGTEPNLDAAPAWHVETSIHFDEGA